MTATIKDIAKAAGVSPTTVSGALNNDPRVNAKTKKLVMRVAKDLNYHPNLLARSLHAGKTNQFAVMTPFFASLFESDIMKGIELVIKGSKFSVSQYSTQGSVEQQNEMLESILYSKRADALIMLNVKPGKAMLDEYTKNKLPVVLIEYEMKGAYSVRCDGHVGAYKAVEHLVRTGRKKIGFIGIEPGKASEDNGRLGGYKAALAAHGIKFNEQLVYLTKNSFFENGPEALKSLMRNKSGVDAVFSASGDLIAMGVISAAKQLKIKVPQDIAVIGYDDIFCSALIDPPLTSVRQPIIEMGREAVKMAMDAVEGTGQYDKDRPIVMEPELIVRTSA